MFRNLRPVIALALLAAIAQPAMAQPAATQTAQAKQSLIGKDLPPVPEQMERARQVAKELNFPVGSALTPEQQRNPFFAFTLEQLPGVWVRGGLTFKEREMVVIATIIAQGTPAGLQAHLQDTAWRAGISERELQEVILTTCMYGGWPKCATAMQDFMKVMNGPNNWPKELRIPRPENASAK